MRLLRGIIDFRQHRAGAPAVRTLFAANVRPAAISLHATTFRIVRYGSPPAASGAILSWKSEQCLYARVQDTRTVYRRGHRQHHVGVSSCRLYLGAELAHLRLRGICGGAAREPSLIWRWQDRRNTESGTESERVTGARLALGRSRIRIFARRDCRDECTLAGRIAR
jgi:hypothetical protein